MLEEPMIPESMRAVYSIYYVCYYMGFPMSVSVCFHFVLLA